MKPSVYIETTIIGYLTSRLRNDPITAGHQLATRQWWTTAADRFDLHASEFVLHECSKGDTAAVEDRMRALSNVKILRATAQAKQLAEELMAGFAVPETEPEDAAHIAIAAVNGIQYLVTWNFRHIANAAVRSTIERICREAEYEAPIICTVEELKEIDNA